jgi:predicted DNA-binding antitoxin AbrB/MazE fold protein
MSKGKEPAAVRHGLLGFPWSRQMIIKAICEDGVFKPKHSLRLEEHTEVKALISEAASADDDVRTEWKAVVALIGFIDDAPADMAEHRDEYLGARR